MSKRHKVFVSYRHAPDETYMTKFEQFGCIFDVLVPGFRNSAKQPDNS